MAEGHGLAASFLSSRAQDEAREGVLAEQEATVQELRQMQPVQAELEISREKLDAFGMQVCLHGRVRGAGELRPKRQAGQTGQVGGGRTLCAPHT